MRPEAAARQLLAPLASNRLTMAGFALLALGILLSYNDAEASSAAMVAPLALLTVNLAAAMVLRPALRRGGLGVFHAALLAIALLAGWGRLTHMDGRVEVTEGTPLDPLAIEVTRSGAWHGHAWRTLDFMQGEWQVDYAPRVWRTHTRSQVWLPGERAPHVVGDDTPLVLEGYRFYTTSNKGFAPILSWQAPGQEPVLGSVHMPSYPTQDWNQENRWTAPDGRVYRFWLRVEQAVPEDRPWTLSSQATPTLLVVEVDGQRHELKPGASVPVAGAMLKYERLSGWMGYRIFYDPTLLPLLFASLFGVAGLAWHLWKRTGALAPAREAVPA
jgi:hypothetical protein